MNHEMSEVFHKSCYTSRSSGYKYRTLSTNTGDRKKRDSNVSSEDSVFDRKFKKLNHEITSRVDSQIDQAQRARKSIQDKLEKIDSKINSMLELRSTVMALRKNLNVVEDHLSEMIDKVLKIEAVVGSDSYSLKSKRTSIRSQLPIFEEREVFVSTLTHI